MMGSFLSRTLLMALGYVYPAYECFKAVEKSKPEMEELLFWCQYWILVAILTVCERFGDSFGSWLPLYNEAKLALVVYLWYPKWKGTAYIYNSFVRPHFKSHGTKIDRNLSELKGKARQVGGLYCRRAVTYGQTRFIEILQSFSSDKALEPYLHQPNQDLSKTESLASCQASVTKPEELKEAVPDSSSLSEMQQFDTTNGSGFLLTSQNHKRMISAQSCVKTTGQLSVTRVVTGPIHSTSSSGNGNSNSSHHEQTSNYKESKLHGIWRIFKTASH